MFGTYLKIIHILKDMIVKKSNIIRINDVVKIKNPSFFLRCGYEMCIKEVAQQLQDSHSQELKELITNILFKDKKIKKNVQFNLDLSKIQNQFFLNLAYEKCALKNFGGNERKIKVIEIPELKDTTFKVESIKFVKTGFRTTHYDYEDGYKFSYLKDEHTHKILNLCYDYNTIHSIYDTYGEIASCLKIEAVNVEKIK